MQFIVDSRNSIALESTFESALESALEILESTIPYYRGHTLIIACFLLFKIQPMLLRPKSGNFQQNLEICMKMAKISRFLRSRDFVSRCGWVPPLWGRVRDPEKFISGQKKSEFSKRSQIFRGSNVLKMHPVQFHVI